MTSRWSAWSARCRSPAVGSSRPASRGSAWARLRSARARLIGATFANIDAAAVAAAAVADTQPFDDHHATADYRRTVGRRIFARALGEALDLKAAA